MDEIKIVIGSWGSYNECNDRALGSKWLDLSDYNDWEEIEEELKKEGFILNGIDEELFIQDVMRIPDSGINWDYVHPKTLFETLYESGILNDKYKKTVFDAFLEVRSYDDFEDLVSRHGESWDDNIYLYENYDWDDFGRYMIETLCIEIPEQLECYIDYEAYGRSFQFDGIHEYSNGIIEIGY